ncbi:POT family proton-dependent oligopeptide transporter [Parabacteroides sp. PF5-5]|uniref:peptide MFS transporter n=1 Tax=unclassified Parabacteroides TaxID=2649774 RepID=UPI0024772207|nr:MULTISPECIES: peptide MFS transporter [unclassified Parabacteroides]MDH6304700.1 POT family proton-dependent oligopeptide transporter [Parabacteroides sp. PH5-39]MDH6315685.1 POT family proton-dependent oligopeptide transporter [Parabacteroides sp. PF5-13]MDH6319346.1 POT family proton-dependent oligopeptide transporter [Parabacteroides sp. PH5-13]MDH6323077.1 POT family proton-dependent oligopeptide transporter [Parabacteroides sp. PH5-8]MDH6326878.1 POT family proton-dependent oligopeptid
MFKNHPKGLIGAALSNMGERFGFYIMMAILSLFLMSKFGLEKTESTIIYSIFYALIYLLALAGGFIADKTKKYKGTILAGLLCMSIGYALIAIPTPTPVPNLPLFLTLTCIGLFVIAFGNGLFKGNLQAVVGQMYDDPKYSDKRDTGFQIFYMFINIGALFAPLIAVGIRNWWVAANGFTYNPDLPALCHQFLKGTISSDAAVRFGTLASDVSQVAPADLTAFANQYLNVFNTGFHYAFGAAVVAMLISLVVFLSNKNSLPDPALKAAANKASGVADNQPQMSSQEIRQRLYALFAVFAVVIFFWFSFHQNGVTLTFFANDYTNLSWLKFDLGFTTIEGAEVFQFFNPFFVVFLTPVVIGFFGWLRARGKEPSTPRKIAIGMGIAAIAFVVMAIGSFGLPSADEVKAMGGLSDAMRVTPFLLIGTYFILTVAELFISPLGLSFVSKVAPPQYQGIMQGCWLGATALGNQLLILGTVFYENIPIWATWCVFVTACLISMGTMLAMLKWLERIAK